MSFVTTGPHLGAGCSTTTQTAATWKVVARSGMSSRPSLLAGNSPIGAADRPIIDSLPASEQGLLACAYSGQMATSPCVPALAPYRYLS